MNEYLVVDGEYLFNLFTIALDNQHLPSTKKTWSELDPRIRAVYLEIAEKLTR